MSECPGAPGQGRVCPLPCRGAGKGAEGTAGHQVRGTGLCGFGAACSREALASFMHCR